MTTAARPNKALFAVFSDECDSQQQSSISRAPLAQPPCKTNSSKLGSSSLSSAKIAIYHDRQPALGPAKSVKTTRLASTKASFAVLSDASADTSNKENTNPLLGKTGNIKSDKQMLKSKSFKEKSTPISKLGHHPKSAVTLPEKQPQLWAGKVPFGAASPESCTCSKAATKAKSIYDLPGTGALDQQITKPIRAEPSSRARNAYAGMAISRPNKKKTADIQIFQDPTFVRPSSKDLLARKGLLDSPITLNANRRARELTESPLADVSAAYLGRGKFSNSPSVSIDSGFASATQSREASFSPVKTALSMHPSSSQDLHDIQFALSSTDLSASGASWPSPITPASPVRNTSLPRLVRMHSSPKRRFSQLSRDEAEGQDISAVHLNHAPPQELLKDLQGKTDFSKTEQPPLALNADQDSPCVQPRSQNLHNGNAPRVGQAPSIKRTGGMRV